MSIIKQDFGSFQDMATQHMLAPIFPTLVATQALNIGDLFIFNNELYKATKAIASGAAISIGTGANDNATSASTLAEEMSDVKQIAVKGSPIEQLVISRSTTQIMDDNAYIFADNTWCSMYPMYIKAGNQPTASFAHSGYYYVPIAECSNDLLSKKFNCSNKLSFTVGNALVMQNNTIVNQALIYMIRPSLTSNWYLVATCFRATSNTTVNVPSTTSLYFLTSKNYLPYT